MRLLVTFSDEKQAITFSRYLSSRDIEANVEQKEKEYLLWILDEDEYESARVLYEEYVKNPNELPASPPQEDAQRKTQSFEVKLRPFAFAQQRRSIITYVLIAICAFIYVTNLMQRTTPSGILLGMTPTTKALLYDFPSPMQKIIALLDQTGVSTQKEFEALPEATKKEIEMLEVHGYWRGIYFTILEWPKSKEDLSAPMFTDIRKGEAWRLITPTVLHVSFLHILFNMLWLFYLGRMVEERVSIAKYLGMSLLIGVVTNTLQYLVSGPFFMGYSGVVVGLAGFIWMRQRIAPWEGYPLAKGTFIFLVAFVVGMALLQLASFFLIRFGIAQFEMNIANTAHISGGIMGILLGRLSFFNKGVV